MYVAGYSQDVLSVTLKPMVSMPFKSLEQADKLAIRLRELFPAFDWQPTFRKVGQ